MPVITYETQKQEQLEIKKPTLEDYSKQEKPPDILGRENTPSLRQPPHYYWNQLAAIAIGADCYRHHHESLIILIREKQQHWR